MSARIIDLAAARALRARSATAVAHDAASMSSASAGSSDAPAASRRTRIVLEHAQSASAKFELAASMLDDALGDLALSGVRLAADDVTRLRQTIMWLETRALRVDETATPTTLEDIA